MHHRIYPYYARIILAIVDGELEPSIPELRNLNCLKSGVWSVSEYCPC